MRVQIAIEAGGDDLTGAARRAKAAGFSAVAVRRAGGQWGPGLSGLADGVGLAAVIATDSPADEVSCEGREAVLQAWRGRIEQTRAAGGSLLIVPLDFAGAVERFDERVRLAMESLRGLRFAAERSGVRLAVRVGAAVDGWSAGCVRDFVDDVNSHWVACEVTLSDALTLEALAILTHRVAAIRIERPGAWDSTDLAALAAALREVDFDGIVIVGDEPGAEKLRDAIASGGDS